MAMPVRCDRTPAWAALRAHFEGAGRSFDLRTAFEVDPRRCDDFQCEAPQLFADLSKTWLDRPSLTLLLRLAQEVDLPGQRDAMFAGEAINLSEGRAVLHTALRAPRGSAPHGDEVHATLDAMLAYAESVRDTAASGIRDVVNIGIGGSDLGPQMAVPALAAYGNAALRHHFIANVDGHAIAPLLLTLDPRQTLFVVASKTFTTQETLANAQTARVWFEARGGGDVGRHFVALTTNVEAAAAFGIRRSFGFWDWVGGRYSLWSAIGLSLAIAIGEKHFRALLAGAHAMDRHFVEAPLACNLPVLLGLLDVWYRNFHGLASRCVAPYHQGLARLPAYLQQLEMESNGKRVDRHGTLLPYSTAPVVWGEPGSTSQHAYFQLLHQGSDVIPVDFIAVRETSHHRLDLPPAVQAQLAGQHQKLLANCLAQSQALMLGQDAVSAYRNFPGNRPSTTLLLERLDPAGLGALLALHEHRVFTSGAVWGINSFDQWGVELGKSLCSTLLPRLASGDTAGLDPSTAALVDRLRR